MADSQDPDEPGGRRPTGTGDPSDFGDEEWVAEQDDEGGNTRHSRESAGDYGDDDGGYDEEAEPFDLGAVAETEEEQEEERAGTATSMGSPEGSVDAGTPTPGQGSREQHAAATGSGNQILQAVGDITIGDTAERPEFRPVPMRELERSRSIFVAPPGYQRVAAAPIDAAHPRVFLVYGPDHAGKRTCAANLAQDLLPRLTPKAGAATTIQQYARPERSQISLADAITSTKLPGDAVILLDDCFKRNVRPEELERFPIAELRTALAAADSLLILTGDLRGEPLEAVSAEKLDAQVDDRRAILRANLRYSLEHEGLPITRDEIEGFLEPRFWRELDPLLPTPFHIARLCSRLREALARRRGAKPLHAIVLEAAKAVSVLGRGAARAWFDALPTNNDKLFGPLVYLFASAERQWLEQLTRQVVQRLRTDWLGWLSDPREHGLDDALDRLQLVDRGGRLVFVDDSYVEEVRRQLANRHHLLWDALWEASDPELVSAEAESPQRQALGVALGRLGPHDPERLVSLLEKLATEGDPRRAVIAAYALEEMARSESPLDVHLALRILGRWVRSDEARLMWAAAAAAWHVFRVHAKNQAPSLPQLGDLVLGLIDTLSKNLGNLRSKKGELPRWEVERGLVRAMREVVLADPERGGKEVRRWIASGQPRHRHGLAVVRSLCVVLARGRSKPSQAQVSCFLRWVTPLLAASPGTPAADLVLLTLRSALSTPGAPDQIGRALLGLATHERLPIGERLRAALTRLWLEPRPKEAVALAEGLRGKQHHEIDRLLTRWCEGNETPARQIARAVIARSYAVEGALPSVPMAGRAVVVVDPELLAAGADETSPDAHRALWRLLAILDSRFELALLRLGEPATTPLSDRLAALELVPDFPTHRLMMPALSNATSDGEAELFVIAVQPPHDLDDAQDLPSVRSACYIGPGYRVDAASDWSPGETRIDLPWPPTAEQLEASEAALEDRFSRGLAAAPAEVWLDLLRRCGVAPGQEHDWPALLTRWSAALDRALDEQVPALDPVWKSTILLLFVHASAPELALAWIASHLTPGSSQDSTNERVIARAAAFALIRLDTAHPAGAAGSARPSTRLFDVLAAPLGSQGADGVAAIVRLVSHWIDDPFWCRHLAGDVQLGKGRLERWAAVHLEKEPMLAEDLSRRLAAARLGLEDDGVALTAALDRLRARQALEHPEALPKLRADEQYAVVVVNTAAEPGARERHLASLAGPLCRQLSETSGGQLVPAIFRLGETAPYWTAVAERPITERLLEPGIRLPPLIGPLLEKLDVERVALMVLLSSNPPIDLDDWLETRWWSKVRLYQGGRELLLASFATLPKPRAEADRTAALHAEDDEPRMLAALVTRPTGAGAASRTNTSG